MTQGLPLPISRLALGGGFHECSLQGLLMQHDAPYSRVELFHQLAQSVSCVEHLLQSLPLVQEGVLATHQLIQLVDLSLLVAGHPLQEGVAPLKFQF